MKKSIVFLAAFFVVALAALAATGMKWVCVHDSCGKCVINDIDRKCGLCGGFMKSGKSEWKPGDWIQSTYTCKKCNHQAIYKCHN